jgi:hypothetical protein
MNDIKIKNKIEEIMARTGRSVWLSAKDGWKSPLYKALVQPLRYKNKMYLEQAYLSDGIDGGGFYLYIGPARFDITGEENRRVLRINASENSYYIRRAEKVFVGDTCVYVWAVIKTVTEEKSLGQSF